MPRIARHAPSGFTYHVLNRAVARLPLFRKEADYLAFERVVEESHEKFPIDILAYCVMPNHWHFLLRPTQLGQLTSFLRWLTHTHTMRWHAHHRTVGTGHLYQGRFKSFAVQDDDHFYTIARYIERNALRAGLVRKAELWPWCSLARMKSGDAEAKNLLSAWPLPRPRDWAKIVHEPQTDAELEAIRVALYRNRPFGDASWQKSTAKRLGLQSTLRPRGRPKKE